MKKKTYSVLLCVALVLALVSCAGLLTIFIVKSNQVPEYTIYIGENDKDTETALYTEEEAVEIIDSVCEKYFSGYTLYMALGRWAGPSGTFTHENTVVCYVTDVDSSLVKAAVLEILEKLNQYSILVETKRSFSFEVTAY